MKNLLPFQLLIFSLLSACETVDKELMQGLWTLDEINVDIMPLKVNPTLLAIRPNSTFAVSTTQGDQVGLYQIKDKRIGFQSADGKWFNAAWEIYLSNDYLYLTGLSDGYRRTKLRFKKIEKIPTYDEFEESVCGDWEFYKIRNGAGIKKLTNTWFKIDAKSYVIMDHSGLVESGEIVINTRHRKVIFDDGETSWNAWFYGRELRLDNEHGVQYSLRKPTDISLSLND